MGFNTPISCLAFLCFFNSIDNYRIRRIFKWAFVLFTINLVLYFINYLGLGIYDNIKEITEETHQGITITRNLSGYPVYFPLFFVISFYLTLLSFRPLTILITLFSLFIVYISATRNFIFTSLITLSIILFFYILKRKSGFFKRVLQIIISLVFFFIIVVSLKNDVYQFLKVKFDTTIKVELKENTGTYAYRTRLIETSIQEVESTGDIIFGKGYTRFGKRGSYKFVLGGDTLVAPVIFCEGYLGLAIRIVPIFYFLFWGLKRLRASGVNQYIGLAMVAVVIGSSVNYVQTTIFFNYIEYMLYFFVAHRYLVNLEGEEELMEEVRNLAATT